MSDSIAFGKRLTEARKAANITQGELANHCRISRQSIYEYERGSFKPKYSVVLKMAEILKTDVEFLYYGFQTPSYNNITYKELLLHYLGLEESYIFTEEIIEENGIKKLIMTTDNQDFIEYVIQIKNLSSIKGSLNQETVSLVLKELLDSYDITLFKSKSQE